MNLLLDIGNSRVKWALVEDEHWLAEGAEPLAAQRREWPLLRCLDRAPARVMAVNVAGSAVAGFLGDAVRDAWGLSIEFAASGAEFDGLRNGYREPLQLGADRWLAMLAARRAAAGAVCVVDAGTALTVDLVEADGRHLGGFILPGAELMRRSLEQATGDIRGLPARPDAAARGPGADTRSAIDAAVLQASLGLIERARAMTSTPATVVLSGGAAPALLDGLPAGTINRPRAVLEGLLLAFSGPAAAGADA